VRQRARQCPDDEAGVVQSTARSIKRSMKGGGEPNQARADRVGREAATGRSNAQVPHELRPNGIMIMKSVMCVNWMAASRTARAFSKGFMPQKAIEGVWFEIVTTSFVADDMHGRRGCQKLPVIGCEAAMLTPDRHNQDGRLRRKNPVATRTREMCSSASSAIVLEHNWPPRTRVWEALCRGRASSLALSTTSVPMAVAVSA